jgi:hypothetical protein
MATEVEGQAPVSGGSPGEPALVQRSGEAVAAAKPAEGESGGTPSDLIGWFNSEIQKHQATFIVYYRGTW